MKKTLLILLICLSNLLFSQQLQYYNADHYTSPFVISSCGLPINQLVFCVDSNKFFRLTQIGSNGMSLSNTNNVPLNDSGNQPTYWIKNGGNLSLTTNTDSVVIGDTLNILTTARKPALSIGRNINWANINYDNVRDMSVVTPTANGSAECAFDNSTKATTAYSYLHLASFQDRLNFQGTSTVDHIWGFYSLPTIGSGTITDRYGFIAKDPTGSGTLTNNYGLFVDPLSKGTNNYAIYTSGSTKNYFGGPVSMGGTTLAATTLSVKSTSTGGLLLTSNDYVAGSVGSATYFNYSGASGDVATQIQATITGGTANGNIALNPTLGNVGIGTASPLALLHVGSGSFSVLGSNVGMRVEPVWTSSPGAFDRGMIVRPTFNYSVTTNAIGIQSTPVVGSGKLIPTLYGYYYQPVTTGNITTHYGIYIDAKSGAGTITNNYDAIFNGGGKVGIGMTAPSKTLDITGTIGVSGHTTFEGITSTGATGTGNIVYSVSPTFTGTVVATTITAALTGVASGNLATPTLQYVVPVTTNTVTGTQSSYTNLVCNPAGTLAALTINFPTSPNNGDIFNVMISQIITVLTLNGNGNTVDGTLSSVATNGKAGWVYVSSITTWFQEH